jgi:hypothetical protein
MTVSALCGRLLLLGAFLAWTAACADSPSVTARGGLEDGGITVDIARPHLVIGEVDSLPGQSLFGIATAARLSTGEVLLASGSDGEIRVFDTSGRLLRRFGRLGSGPGEFARLWSAWLLSNDTILVYDIAARRLTHLSPAGSLITTMQVPLAGTAQVLGRAATGDVVAFDLPARLPLQAGATTVDSATIVSTRPGGTEVREIVRIPWSTVHGTAIPPSGHVIRNGLPFTPAGIVAFGGEHLYVGYGDRWEIEQRDVDGSLVRSLVVPLERRLLTKQMLDEWRQSRLDRAPPAQRADLARLIDGLPSPEERLPAFDRLFVDQTGSIWIRQFVAPNEESALWVVLAPDGGVAGTLTLSVHYRITFADHEVLIGVLQSPDTPERVIVYDILRR